jgi:hypothetical protein
MTNCRITKKCRIFGEVFRFYNMFLRCSRQRWCFEERWKYLESLKLRNASVSCSHLVHVVHVFNLFEEFKSDVVFNIVCVFKNNVQNINDIEDRNFSDKFVNYFKIYSKNTLKHFVLRTLHSSLFFEHFFSAVSLKWRRSMKQRVSRSNYSRINYWYEFRIDFFRILCTCLRR